MLHFFLRPFQVFLLFFIKMFSYIIIFVCCFNLSLAQFPLPDNETCEDITCPSVEVSQQDVSWLSSFFFIFSFFLFLSACWNLVLDQANRSLLSRRISVRSFECHRREWDQLEKGTRWIDQVSKVEKLLKSRIENLVWCSKTVASDMSHRVSLT